VGSAASARLGDEDPPYVLFICQDQEQRDLFMTAADHELTGYRWHATAPDQHRYLGRQRVLFATEIDIHQDRLEARRLAPNRPAEADNSRPDTEIRGVKLPGPLTDAQGETHKERRSNPRNKPSIPRSRPTRPPAGRRREARTFGAKNYFVSTVGRPESRGCGGAPWPVKSATNWLKPSHAAWWNCSSRPSAREPDREVRN
jgi:hypothetical protein